MNTSVVFARTGVRARATAGMMLLRSSHHHWTNTGGKSVPFSTKNKPALAFKVVAFFGTGFGIGFLPGQWQAYKRG